MLRGVEALLQDVEHRGEGRPFPGLARGALEEAARAVQAEYGFGAAEMARWVEDTVRCTDIPALGDTVRRFGADPRRKLRRERLLVSAGAAVDEERRRTRAVIELPEIQRAQLMVFAALPPAVLNFMLAERYGIDPRKVAAIVLLGNLASVLVLPLVLFYVL